MIRAALVCLALVACGGGGATVVEVPPQDLPAPAPAQTQTAIVQASAPSTPLLQRGDEWIGSYRCAQGQTDLALHIQAVRGDQVDAVFEFLHGPSNAGGSYRMHGRIDAQGALRFSPSEWIDQPPGYVMVGMHGVVRGTEYSGRIDNASCGDFRVTRR